MRAGVECGLLELVLPLPHPVPSLHTLAGSLAQYQGGVPRSAWTELTTGLQFGHPDLPDLLYQLAKDYEGLDAVGEEGPPGWLLVLTLWLQNLGTRQSCFLNFYLTLQPC